MKYNAELIKKKYSPMNESAFLILFSMQQPIHGYQIMKYVKEITKGRVIIGNGTMYGTISKLKKDLLIEEIEQEGQKKIYFITDLGREILTLEKLRISQIYNLIKE